MDSDIEPTQPGDPVFPRRLLGRADRALCRRLANHQITPKVLARHYKCADKTIRKIIQNKYSPKDDLTKDPAVLPADWKQTLDALSREDMPSGAKRAEHRNDLAAADKMNNRRNVATRANEPTG
ncbi:hypothetical protein B0H11DRAFT_2226653 [Mycena galericulata]|nr:hypothetical protein B0H11DRAFT_2226653 [Mycena galericulata]